MTPPPYVELRDSGVEWLGSLPSHWGVHRLKWTVTGCANGVWGDEPDGLNDVVCVRVADFDRDALRVSLNAPTLRAVEPSQLATRKLQRSDLLIEKSGGGDRQLVGCVVSFDHDVDAVCSNFVARMPVDVGHCARYWCYAHAGLYAGRLNYPAIKQTTGIQNLDAGAYLDTLVAYPPFEEQQKIAEYLDWKTGQIDELVEKKRALVSRLKEKRLVVITQAVTEVFSCVGKNGRDAPARDLRRMRFVAEVNPSSPKLRSLDPRSEISFVPMDAVGIDGGLDLSATKSIEEVSVGYTEFEEGDVIVAKITPCFENGKAAIAQDLSNETALGTTELHVLRVFPETEKRFLFYVVTSHLFRQLGESEMYGAGGQKRVPPNFVKNFRVSLPSIDEQLRIADHLDREVSKLDAVIRTTEIAIEKLMEYRSGLISAATTGKLNIRNSVARK